MTDDPRASGLDLAAVLTKAHCTALAAGFEDPIWGTAVVLAKVVARISERMPEFRKVANGSGDR